MRINQSDLYVNERDSRRIIRSFIDITGERVWRDKTEIIMRTRREGHFNFVLDYLFSRNLLLKTLKKYFELDDGGRSIHRNLDSEMKWLVTNAHAINLIRNNLSSRAKEKLKSLLIADGSNSIFYEIEVAINYLSHNFDVEFVDLESEDDQQNTFDLLIKKDAFEGEIECKCIDYDTGKKITKIGFYHLMDEIAPILMPLRSRNLIRISCDNKLEKNQERLKNLSIKIRDNISAQNNSFRVDKKDISITSLVQLNNNFSYNDLDDIIKRNINIMSHGAFITNRQHAFIVIVESKRQNEVTNSIYRTLKKAAKKQLTKNRSSIIACFIDGVQQNDWEMLKQDSELANMTGSIFERSSLSHLNFVFYSSTPVLQMGSISERFRSPTLRFQNPNSKFSEYNHYFES